MWIDGNGPSAGGKAGCRPMLGLGLGGGMMFDGAEMDRRLVSGGVITCSVRRPECAVVRCCGKAVDSVPSSFSSGCVCARSWGGRGQHNHAGGQRRRGKATTGGEKVRPRDAWWERIWWKASWVGLV
jgi:hypothetical protein